MSSTPSHLQPPGSGLPAPADRYVARQPIVDPKRNVFGYELLFRGGPENLFDAADRDAASARVVAETLQLFGFDALSGGRRAFVNVTRRVLVEDLVGMLPPARTVIEILEDVPADAEVVAACRRLRKAGYLIALDDWVQDDPREPLLELTDIVKIDFVAHDPAARRAIRDHLAPRRVRLLAEKVETRADVEDAAALGCTLLQGFFFQRPEMIARKELTESRLGRLRLLRELHRAELDRDALEQVIRSELSLSVKLLRYLNSVSFAWRSPVTSIRDALIRLGDRPLTRWATLVALTGLADEAGQVVAGNALVRARFCEQLANAGWLRHQSSDLFLAGLLSHLDVLMGRPLPELLDELNLSETIRRALLEEDAPEATVVRFATAWEAGQWDVVAALVGALGIQPPQLPDIYNGSLAWADAQRL